MIHFSEGSFDFAAVGALIIQYIGLFSALKSVSSKNPVSCILWLVVVFMSFSYVIIYIGAEFLGLVYLVVYVGAIAVLFLFVVMMLNVRVTELNSMFLSYFPLAGFLLTLFDILISIFFYSTFSMFDFNVGAIEWVETTQSVENLKVFGQVLYTYYAFFFLLASLLLLVAMIGAITLTLQRRDPSTVKKQFIPEQLSRSFSSTLRLQDNL